MTETVTATGKSSFRLGAPMRPSTYLRENRYDFAYERLQAVKDQLPSRLVFDVGCGDGRMRKVETLGLAWRGFDRGKSRKEERWDLNGPAPLKEKAGAVLLLDVIECCVNPGLALQNLAAAMAPGAVLILTVPNPHWSASRTFYLFSGLISSFRPFDVVHIHHIFTPWPHVLLKLLQDAGLEVEDYVSLDGPSPVFRQRISVQYPLRVLNGLVRRGIEALDKRSVGMSYALVARKI